MLKFVQGGWVPLALAVLIFTAMWTWMRGRMAVATRETEHALPMEQLLASISPSRAHRPQGTAVYLTAFAGNAPSSCSVPLPSPWPVPSFSEPTRRSNAARGAVDHSESQTKSP